MARPQKLRVEKMTMSPVESLLSMASKLTHGLAFKFLVASLLPIFFWNGDEQSVAFFCQRLSDKMRESLAPFCSDASFANAGTRAKSIRMPLANSH